MVEFLVGTGGWGYFKVGTKPSLKSYSEVFGFVEVNNTFYEYPKMQMIESWRRSVPSSFVFSVRCHQDLTHKIGLRPANQAYEIFYHMRTYCDALKSSYLVLETPASYVLGTEEVRIARDFFSSLNLKEIRLVWEYRAPLTRTVIDLMLDFGIIQCIDLSKQASSYNLDVSYSRLFGKGQHNIYQFTDDELLEIEKSAEYTKAQTVILAFHGPRMNTDAARFQMHRQTGKFLPVSSYFGADSAKAVLAEDAQFPSTKLELKVEQGWKVIDLSQDRRVHLSDILEKVPDKTYSNLDEVITELRKVL